MRGLHARVFLPAPQLKRLILLPSPFLVGMRGVGHADFTPWSCVGIPLGSEYLVLLKLRPVCGGGGCVVQHGGESFLCGSNQADCFDNGWVDGGVACACYFPLLRI